MDELRKSPGRIYGSTSFQTPLHFQEQQKRLKSWRWQYTPFQEGKWTATTALLSENRWMAVCWCTDGLITFSSTLRSGDAKIKMRNKTTIVYEEYYLLG